MLLLAIPAFAIWPFDSPTNIFKFEDNITLVTPAGGGSGFFSTNFTDGNLTANILIVDHNLIVAYPAVVVYDDSENIIIPDDVTFVDVNRITIDLTSFTPLSSTWNVSIIGGALDVDVFTGNFVTSTIFNNAFPLSFDGNVSFDSNTVLDGRYVQIIDLNNGTVSQIIAGTNINISPTNGVGVVTINSTASGADGSCDNNINCTILVGSIPDLNTVYGFGSLTDTFVPFWNVDKLADSPLSTDGTDAAFAGDVNINGGTIDLADEGSSTNLRQTSYRDAAAHNLFTAFAARGTSASPVILNDGDAIYAIRARGWDGSAFVGSSQIDFKIDGTPGVGDMPGRIVFSTSPDGSSSVVEAVIINSSQDVNIISDLTIDGEYIVGSTGVNANAFVFGGDQDARLAFEPLTGTFRFYNTAGNISLAIAAANQRIAIGQTVDTSDVIHATEALTNAETRIVVHNTAVAGVGNQSSTVGYKFEHVSSGNAGKIIATRLNTYSTTATADSGMEFYVANDNVDTLFYSVDNLLKSFFQGKVDIQDDVNVLNGQVIFNNNGGGNNLIIREISASANADILFMDNAGDTCQILIERTSNDLTFNCSTGVIRLIDDLQLDSDQVRDSSGNVWYLSDGDLNTTFNGEVFIDNRSGGEALTVSDLGGPGGAKIAVESRDATIIGVQELGSFTFRTKDNSTNVEGVRARITGRSASTFNDNDAATQILFQITPDSSTTLTDALVLDENTNAVFEGRVVGPFGTFWAYKAFAGASFTATDSYGITWDTEGFKDDEFYTHAAASSIVTLIKPGQYKVSYGVPIDVFSGIARSTSKVWATIDGSTVPGSGGTGYHRTTGNGDDTVNKVFIVTSTGNQDLNMHAQRNTGADTLFTQFISAESVTPSILIEYLGNVLS